MKWFAILIVIFLLLFGCNMQSNENNNALMNDNNINDTSGVPDDYVDINKINVDLTADANSGHVQLVVSLTNDNEQPAKFTFSNGQVFEIEVKGEDETIFREFYIDEALSKEGNEVILQQGERKSWTTSWNYNNDGNDRVSEGVYDISVYLLPFQISNMEVNDSLFVSSTTVEVPKENNAFRNVSVQGSNGKYKVTGEARVFEAQFMFMVEDGHNILIEETPVQVSEGGPSWSPFELDIVVEEEDLPSNGTLTLVLYERSAKDDSMVNQFYLALEHFD